MKPICVPCERFMRMKKAGISFIEGMPLNGHARPGKAEPEWWKPYKLWMGDLWTCPDCGTESIVGAGQKPIAEHYQPDFSEKVKSFDAQLLVKDC